MHVAFTKEQMKKFEDWAKEARKEVMGDAEFHENEPFTVATIVSAGRVSPDRAERQKWAPHAHVCYLPAIPGISEIKNHKLRICGDRNWRSASGKVVYFGVWRYSEDWFLFVKGLFEIAADGTMKFKPEFLEAGQEGRSFIEKFYFLWKK
jgi:hypothetical protein